MEKLPMCRICLAQNVRMYVVVNKDLHVLYERLTDNPFITKDNRPMLACYFCCTILRQCCRFQRKCLETEEWFAQMMNKDYEPKSIINQNFECFNGLIQSPMMHVSVIDECRTESDAIKEHLPAVCERPDDIIEPKQEYQSDENGLPLMEIKMEEEELTEIQRTSDTQEREVENQVLYYSDSNDSQQQLRLEGGLPLMEIKTEEEEQEVTEKPRVSETEQLEMEILDSDNEASQQQQQFHLEGGVPLMEIKTEEKEAPEVTEKPRASDPQKAIIIAFITGPPAPNQPKPMWLLRRTKPQDGVTEEHKKTDHSDTKVPKNDVRVTNHRRQCLKEKPFRCTICLRNFYQKGHLKQHIRIHTDEKPFKCDICLTSFNTRSSLSNHYRLHSGQKPYKCDTCQHCFSDKEALKKHYRIHTGEKPYKCVICDRCFSQSSSLKAHIRLHTGERPYKCVYCKLTFIRRFCLTAHLRTHTGEKPFKCEICLTSFRTKKILLNHVRIHKGQKA